MSVPNLKRIALFVQVIRVSQNFEIGSREPKPRPFGTLNDKFV